MSAGAAVQETRRIVHVPDVPWHDLVMSVLRKVGRTNMHPFLQDDLYRGERGRSYEAIVWKPGRVIEGLEARSWLKRQGFDGNFAVFVAWSLSMIDPTVRDRFITIPDRTLLLTYKRKENMSLCLLRGYRTCGWGCSLTLSAALVPLHTHWSFVAFREMEAS